MRVIIVETGLVGLTCPKVFRERGTEVVFGASDGAIEDDSTFSREQGVPG
jgi:hypothetical protein